MRQRRLAATGAAVLAAAALAFVPSSSQADTVMPLPNTTYGTGPVAGTITCTGGVAAITVDAPVFVYDGVAGELHATGSSACSGGSLGDGAAGGVTYDMTAPGVTCAGAGGSWTFIGTNLMFWIVGNCTLANGDVKKLQLFVQAAYTAGTGTGLYAGAGLLNPVP